MYFLALILILSLHFRSEAQVPPHFCKNNFTDNEMSAVSLTEAIQFLAQLELSFQSDKEFLKNSIYREIQIDKFKTEYQKLVNIGGIDFENEYLKIKKEIQEGIRNQYQKKLIQENKLKEDKKNEIKKQSHGLISPELIRETTEPGFSIHTIEFSSDGQQTLSRYGSGEIVITDLLTGKRIFEIENTEKPFLSRTPDLKKVITLTEEGLIRVTDVKTRQEILNLDILSELVKERKKVTFLKIKSDSQSFFIGYKNGLIEERDISTGSILNHWSLEIKADNMKLTPDENKVVIVNYIKRSHSFLNLKLIIHTEEFTQIKIFDFQSNRIIHTFVLPKYLYSIAISPDSQNIIIGGIKSLIFNYSLISGNEISKFQDNDEFDPITHFEFSPDSRYIYYSRGTRKSEIKLLSLKENLSLKILKLNFNEGGVDNFAISPDGSHLVTYSKTYDNFNATSITRVYKLF